MAIGYIGRDQIIHCSLMNRKAVMALARLAGPLYQVPSFLAISLTLHFKTLFHFPPMHVTRGLETRKSEDKADREVDENRMIVTPARLVESSSLSRPLEVVISASPDASVPFGRLVRNNKCACVGPVAELSSSTWSTLPPYQVPKEVL